MEQVLVVGLVCIDKFLVVEKYPQEDSDLPASEVFIARGGNASNNCSVLAQFMPNSVTFLGTLPKPNFGNQYDFVVQDFSVHGIKLSKNCPLRQNCPWPGT